MMIAGIVVTRRCLGRAPATLFRAASGDWSRRGSSGVGFVHHADWRCGGAEGADGCRAHRPRIQSHVKLPGRRSVTVIAEIRADPLARRFTIFVFVSMLAYSAQELILEPFAGLVFHMTPWSIRAACRVCSTPAFFSEHGARRGARRAVRRSQIACGCAAGPSAGCRRIGRWPLAGLAAVQPDRARRGPWRRPCSGSASPTACSRFRRSAR